MPDKKTSDKTPSKEAFSDDPAAAKKAFDGMLPRAQAIPNKDVALINVDLQEAAITALAVARFIAEPEPHARFALLPAKVFDPAHLADLGPFALAASHVHVQLQSARDQSTEAKLPIALVDEATVVKERMLELAGYHFKRDKVLSLEVAGIRAGTGYKDLASDLTRLARIYDDNTAAVEKDAVNYRATDAAAAHKLSQQILTELGAAQSAEEKKWVNLASRVWTLLRAAYFEVQAAGEFLYRHEDPEEKFPSLHASSRVGRPRKGKGQKVGDGPTGSGAALGGGGGKTGGGG